MINELRPIAIFVEVVRSGSFRGASKQLNISPSAVSYNVAQLENRLGNALIYRSTRKLSLTKEGEHLFDSASELLTNITEGLDQITGSTAALRGRLTISVTTALLHSNLNKTITQYCIDYPNVDVYIHYTDERLDLIRDGIDVVLRAGDMPDSAMKSTLVSRIERRLVCSKDYYYSKAPVQLPQQLKEWRWIKLSMMPGERVLRKGRGMFKANSVNSQLSVNSVDAMVQFCSQGMGLATPPDFMVQDLIEGGSLIEVLPDWKVDSIPIYAVWPGNQTKNKNAHRFIEQLKNQVNENGLTSA